jgi:hypothetical protein
MAASRYVRRPTTVTLISAWLIVLALFEVIALLRLFSETIPQVCPLYINTAQTETLFKPIFCLFLIFLILVRINAAIDMRSIAVWRINAGTHIVEAIYYTYTSFSDQGFLGKNGPIKPSTAALLLLGAILLNAVLFTCWWQWLRVRSKREDAAVAAKEEADRKRREALAKTEPLESEDEDSHEQDAEVDDEDDEDDNDDEEEVEKSVINKKKQ